MPKASQATIDQYMVNRLRVLEVIEGVRLFWPYDDLMQVRDYYKYGELALAISLACAYARCYGFGTVRQQMLALADEFGEHDFTPFARHPYMPDPAPSAEAEPERI
jgi:hypothetical protein